MTQLRTPLERAQDLIYEAWECSGHERVRLAAEALKICPDCADAYVILAEESTLTLAEKAALYLEGLKAGERALGPAAFVQEFGFFWGNHRTRPYMRARLGYAQCLLKLGNTWDAMKHFTEMLRLNPSDNQGVRYLLANGLLAERDFITFERMFGTSANDHSAFWLYPQALWKFQRFGRSRRSTFALRKAIRYNKLVPEYLLHRKTIPNDPPDSYQLGSEDEAILYAEDGRVAWGKTPGALEWLKEVCPLRKEEGK